MKALILAAGILTGAFIGGAFSASGDSPMAAPAPTYCCITTAQHLEPGVTVSCRQPDCYAFHVKPYVANDPTCDGVSDGKDALAMLQRMAGIPYAPPYSPLYYCDGQYPGAPAFLVTIIGPAPTLAASQH